MKEHIYQNFTTEQLEEEYCSLYFLRESMVGSLYPRIVSDKMDDLRIIYATREDKNPGGISHSLFKTREQA